MRKFVVSDIHGCSRTFHKLFKDLNLQDNDRLYLLGDYINKGPDSKGVLDLIMRLQEEGYPLYCLRGNHDQMLLESIYQPSIDDWKNEEQKSITLESFQVKSPSEIPQKYFDFIEGLPLFVETDAHFLVHAGFNFSIDNIFEDEKSMMNIKEYRVNSSKIKGKKIVHGHVPQKLEAIKTTLSSDAPVIRIDGGCVYYKNEGLGNLIALDLNTSELIIQPNIDQPYPIFVKKS